MISPQRRPASPPSSATRRAVGPNSFALESLAKCAYLVGHRLVASRTSKEAADPANAVRCGLLLDEPSRQDELTKLLKRGFELTHRPTARGNGNAIQRLVRMIANRVVHKRLAETDRDWVTRRTRTSVHAGCHRVRRIGALHLIRTGPDCAAGTNPRATAASSARKRTNRKELTVGKATQDNCASRVSWAVPELVFVRKPAFGNVHLYNVRHLMRRTPLLHR